jgi:hypothetical protein
MSVAEDTAIVVGSALPRLASVEPAGGHRIVVRWASGPRTGHRETVDLAPVVMTLRYFAPLRADADLFATVELADDGHTLAWGSGRIDMSAATVERLAAEAMDNVAFRAFLERQRLTLDGAAAALGLSRRQVAYYAKDRPVPRLVALACAGYERLRREAVEGPQAGRE